MATETDIKAHTETGGDHHATHHHGGTLLQYWLIAVALLVATVAEVLLADYLKEHNFTQGIIAGSMMGIALVKAALVILYYMHLRYERAILWVIFSIPFALVSLLAIAMFSQP